MPIARQDSDVEAREGFKSQAALVKQLMVIAYLNPVSINTFLSIKALCRCQ